MIRDDLALYVYKVSKYSQKAMKIFPLSYLPWTSFSSFWPSWIELKCAFKFPVSENVFEHEVHLWSFLPSWTELMCQQMIFLVIMKGITWFTFEVIVAFMNWDVLKSPASDKSLPQDAHLKSFWSFSPLWILSWVCFFNSPAPENDFPQDSYFWL